MTDRLTEPQHPSGRELTELERCLFCLYLVGVEAKRCDEVFAGQEDRKRDISLIFTVINQAGIIITKFDEEWNRFNGLAKSDDRVRKLCAAMKPATARIKNWPRLGVFRDQVLGHAYRDRQGRVIHPFTLIACGYAPHATPETMQLVTMARLAATGAIVFFEKEFLGIRPLLEEDFGPEPEPRKLPTPEERDAEIEAIVLRIVAALLGLGVDVTNPLFGKFRPGG